MKTLVGMLVLLLLLVGCGADATEEGEPVCFSDEVCFADGGDWEFECVVTGGLTTTHGDAFMLLLSCDAAGNCSNTNLDAEGNALEANDFANTTNSCGLLTVVKYGQYWYSIQANCGGIEIDGSGLEAECTALP